MANNPLYYADPDDPRLYVYKSSNPRWKWLGVTLNFGHPGAWRALAATLAAVFAPAAALSLLPVFEIGGAAEAAIGFACGALVVVVCVFLCVHFFRAAEHDLRKYGERRNAGDPGKTQVD